VLEGTQAILRSRGLFRTRVNGWLRRVTAVVRIVAGVVFVLFGVVKFIVPEYELAEFVRFGFPASVAIVYVVGLLEIVGGLMLVLGLLTRFAAAALAVNMAGAVLTAGINVGGPIHLGLAPTLLYLLWAGPGDPALDARLDASGRGRSAKR
jgi:putative oxidoreductase